MSANSKHSKQKTLSKIECMNIFSVLFQRKIVSRRLLSHDGKKWYLNTSQFYLPNQGWQRAERAEPRAARRKWAEPTLGLAWLSVKNFCRAKPWESQLSGSAWLGLWHLSSAHSWLARAALRASNKNLHYFKSIKSVAYICALWGANDSFCMLQKVLRVKFAFDEHEHLVAYIWSFWTTRDCICMLWSIKQT